MRLDSDNMAVLGLPKGTILIVDRSKIPGTNTFVMLRHEGRFLCRLLIKNRGKTGFSDGKEEFYPVAGETEIIGAVTASVKIYDNAH